MEHDMMDMGALIMIAALKQKKMINKVILEEGYHFELAHLKILMAAVHFPGKLYAKDLVLIEGKSKSTINALIKKLEMEQLITVEIDKDDKRAKLIRTTEKGVLVDQALALKIHQLVVGKVMKDITTKDAESCISVIRTLISNIDEVIGEESLPYVDLIKTNKVK